MVNRILGVLVVLGVVIRILGIFLVQAIVVIFLVKAIFPVVCKFAVDMSYFQHVTFWTCHIFPSGLCFAGNVDSFTF